MFHKPNRSVHYWIDSDTVQFKACGQETYFLSLCVSPISMERQYVTYFNAAFYMLPQWNCAFTYVVNSTSIGETFQNTYFSTKNSIMYALSHKSPEVTKNNSILRMK